MQLAQTRNQAALADELADGDLLAAWPGLTMPEKRRLLHGLLDRVLVTRASGRGRHANPIAERTSIILRGGTPPHLAGGANKTASNAVKRAKGRERSEAGVGGSIGPPHPSPGSLAPCRSNGRP